MKLYKSKEHKKKNISQNQVRIKEKLDILDTKKCKKYKKLYKKDIDRLLDILN